MEKLGATGDYPRGKIHKDDEGGIKIGVTVKDKTLIIDFGKSITWLGLGKDDAINLANVLLKRSKEL